MGKTLFDKIWDKHVVTTIKDGPEVLYIDRQYIHEVTSPQAFDGIEKRGISIFRPNQTTATPDHNVPTINQDKPIVEEESRFQVQKLADNCKKHGITMYGLGHEFHGVVHILGPELGITKPGMTIVCGDSHTATHGAFGTIAFGIGTSQVEMVLATQCLLQTKPKRMRITIDGELGKGVTSKDIILFIIAKLTASGGTGYFVEYAGSTIRNLSMEARMTICNMSIEMGARGGLIAPDQTTFDYLKGRKFAPQGADFDKAVAEWSELYTDADAKFDAEFKWSTAEIQPMITYGTTPGMGIAITGNVPTVNEVDGESKASFLKSLDYMGMKEGEKIIGKKITNIFVGSCTNGRIEDLRAFAAMVKGKKKAAHVADLIVPGSKLVEQQAIAEGLDKILTEAGFTLRQPGCSACLAMNDDKIPTGEYCVATSNRNFEGRQGPGSRTLLASPITAAACAITGVVTDVRDFL